jgi:hypothetical protein
MTDEVSSSRKKKHPPEGAVVFPENSISTAQNTSHDGTEVFEKTSDGYLASTSSSSTCIQRIPIRYHSGVTETFVMS